jgi:C-terminal processing protease CtpA/Prc
LPISPIWWGSSDSSFEHSFLMSSTNNFHLFDSIDVLRLSTGTVEHLPTLPLDRAPLSPFCSEQLDLPGIPKPSLFTGNLVTWGLFPGTRIGYIFVWGWTGNVGIRFEQAIRALTQSQQTDGLIIDFRFNVGGNMFLSNPGLALLFEHPVPTIGFALRARPDDHLKMELSTPPAVYVIPSNLFANEVLPYDKPIAVLTGPGALSSGDQVALRMTFHPRVRTFGKSTATAFNAPTGLSLSPLWSVRLAVADAFRVNSPHDYLTHDEFVVDEPVWMRPQDVASGRDTVVEAALRWIQSQP